MNYPKFLTKGPESLLSSVPIENGKLRFCTDTVRLFFDVNNKREELTDFVRGYTDAEILSLVSPLPKFYCSSDTNKIYYYTNRRWICYNDYSERAKEADYAEKALKDGNNNVITDTYAPLNSPIFVGSPNAPTAAVGDNSTQVANTEFVAREIKNAIADIIEPEFKIVSSLPDTGKKGYFYLVPKESEEEIDVFDEYIWIEESNKFEKIGNTKIDLSDYVNSFEIVGTGNAITLVTKSGNNLTFTKGATFLTDHPFIIINDPTESEDTSETGGRKITFIDSITRDDNGHITEFTKKSVILPTTVSHSDTTSGLAFAADIDFGDLDESIIVGKGGE